MKKIIAMLLVVVMAIGLCACGAKIDDALVGKYTCYGVEGEGILMPADFVFEDTAFVITLENDGTGSVELDGETAPLTFKVEEGVIHIESEGEHLDATVVDGLMEMEMDGVKMLFAKEGVEAPEIEFEFADLFEDEPVEDEPAEGDEGELDGGADIEVDAEGEAEAEPEAEPEADDEAAAE